MLEQTKVGNDGGGTPRTAGPESRDVSCHGDTTGPGHGRQKDAEAVVRLDRCVWQQLLVVTSYIYLAGVWQKYKQR